MAAGPGGVPAFVPLPSFEFCTEDGPLGALVGSGGVLILQAFLDITDTGRFQIVPPEGSDAVIDATTGQPVEANDLILNKLTGKLNVRVLAVNGELIDPDSSDPLNRVVIEHGKAVWWSPVDIDTHDE